MGVQDDAEHVEPGTVDEWAAWLAEHHDGGVGVWLVSPRRAADRAVSYEVSVIEALRWGWVDSTQKPVDDVRTKQWFAPRRPTSIWTRPNKARVARLETEGRLEAPGRAAVEAAQANGNWTLMDDVDDRVVPDDLAAAFEARPGSREHWDAFSPSAQKQMLAWVVMAKRPATRAQRVTAIAEAAARGEKAVG
ncbi:YdeI/OmpD-associated family protein [Nocardioides terrigena]|uniref:YdeI/OmpD-associated family protein n=1 Tax=Nocardioides terrigena TaxID=424797 RepID=UPI000D310EF8|nr:YdeI/OmpD-associated family protein [Nocardioides terrigena]